jgi:hypothetical protein
MDRMPDKRAKRVTCPGEKKRSDFDVGEAGKLAGLLDRKARKTERDREGSGVGEEAGGGWRGGGRAVGKSEGENARRLRDRLVSMAS